jgi:hypothetical protein
VHALLYLLGPCKTRSASNYQRLKHSSARKIPERGETWKEEDGGGFSSIFRADRIV